MVATTAIMMLCWTGLAVLPTAEAACNVDDHHPEDGGYFVEGIAGISLEVDPESPNNRRCDNATWAPGVDYPDGSVVICTGPFYSEECANISCPRLVQSHTCSQLRFCYASNSGSDVWQLPNEVALANCDFSEASPICDAAGGSSSDQCCNFLVEEDAELRVYFFASQTGCSEGQRVAVEVNDFDEVGAQCRSMGLTSSRIASCDCLHDVKASTLVEPCHSQFSLGCLEGSPVDLSLCCETGSCLALAKNISTPQGQTAEADRVALCNDEIPGRCVSTADDMDTCCTSTCISCGLDLSPDVSWSSCTSGNGEHKNATCGYTSSFTPYICDFAACAEDDLWHPDGDAFQKWMPGISVTEPESVEASIPTTPHETTEVLLSASVQEAPTPDTSGTVHTSPTLHPWVVTSFAFAFSLLAVTS